MWEERPHHIGYKLPQVHSIQFNTEYESTLNQVLIVGGKKFFVIMWVWNIRGKWKNEGVGK